MNLKEETISSFGYEFKIVIDDKIPKDEIWIKDKNTIHKIVNLGDWQVIASGEVIGEKGFFVREFSIGENSIGSVCSKICKYEGKDIEIAVRVKEE
jgi:hypothetical protein